jgi:hypothetical protein
MTTEDLRAIDALKEQRDRLRDELHQANLDLHALGQEKTRRFIKNYEAKRAALRAKIADLSPRLAAAKKELHEALGEHGGHKIGLRTLVLKFVRACQSDRVPWPTEEQVALFGQMEAVIEHWAEKQMRHEVSEEFEEIEL